MATSIGRLDSAHGPDGIPKRIVVSFAWNSSALVFACPVFSLFPPLSLGHRFGLIAAPCGLRSSASADRRPPGFGSPTKIPADAFR